MFYYTSHLDPELIARKMEWTDNVIPASNSEMAINLYLMGQYLDKEDYIKMAGQMANNVKGSFAKGGTYFANWGILLGWLIDSPPIVAIVGPDCMEKRNELEKQFLPGSIVMGSPVQSDLPFLKDKPVGTETKMYVCKDKACLLPVKEVSEVLRQLKSFKSIFKKGSSKIN